ncbi:MAG: putative CRISPR-associated protein [candidate division WOR-3 bacterium]
MKIITMLGTSLFENYFKDNDNTTIKQYYEDLKDKRANEYERNKERIDKIKDAIQKWIKQKANEAYKISAEVKSLKKISEELNEDLEVYLLASDTVLSKLAGEILKECIPEIIPACNIEQLKIIENLQIWDRKDFNKGMSNLIYEIYRISGYYWENIIINITGGYKATIPYLTILAQLNQCPIYYIFEDTNALIKIPNIPFSVSWINCDEIKSYFQEFQKLEKGIDNKSDYEKLKQSDFYTKYSYLIWEAEETLAELNPIGKIIFEKCKSYTILVTEEVHEKIQKNKDLKRLFKDKFWKKEIRESKTENKNGHFVYDDGDNQLRIFYRKKDRLYVYAVFDDHKEYELYLKQPYSEEILNKHKFKEILIKEEEDDV